MRKAGQDPFSKKIFSKDCHRRLQQRMNICSTVAAPRAGSAAAAITDEGANQMNDQKNENRQLNMNEMDQVNGGMISETGGDAPPSMLHAKALGWTFSQYVDIYMKYVTPAQLQIAYEIWCSI